MTGPRTTRVAVREHVQRRGYGRRLLQAAEQFATAHGCTLVVSHVDPGAVGFYERCGFRREADENRTVVMSKQLQ